MVMVVQKSQDIYNPKESKWKSNGTIIENRQWIIFDGGGNLSGEDGEFDGKLPSPGFGENGDLCSNILNESLSKLVKLCITILRIVGAVIAVVNGMITLIPAVVSKNPDALKKAGHKCMLMGCILLAIGVFPTLSRVIARIFGYDVSCIF